MSYNGWSNWETWEFGLHYMDYFVDSMMEDRDASIYALDDYIDFVQSHINDLYSEIDRADLSSVLKSFAAMSLREIDIDEIAGSLMETIQNEFDEE